MKHIIEISVIFFLMFIPTMAQNYENDPLEDGYIIHNGGGEEIVSMDWAGVHILKYYKEMEIAPWDTVINVLDFNHASSSGFPDMAVVDLDGDSLSEIVNVWIENDAVQIAVLKPDPNLLSMDTLAEWKKIVRLQKNNPTLYQASTESNKDFFLPRVVLVQTGNFDSDPQKEFVIAYWADDGNNNAYVNLTVYDVDDTLGVFEKGRIMDQPLPEPPEIHLCEDQTYLFDIECADFNGDGTDEILLGGREPASPSGWQFFAKIYSYDTQSGNILASVKDTLFIQPDPQYDVADLNLAAGHFISMNNEQAIAGFYQYNPYSSANQTPDTVSFTIIPFEVNNLLNEINVGPLVIQKKDTLENQCMYSRVSTLKAADVNHDGLDEILSAFTISDSYPLMKTFRFYQWQTNMNLTVWADLDTISENYHATIAIGNISKETEGMTPYSEFTLPGYCDIYPYRTGSMYQIRYNEDNSFQKVVLLYKDNQNLSYAGKSEPVEIAECDGDIRLGSPKRYSATEILQPMVILNAPPIHFDVFDNQIYDVCTSYNGNNPQFIASYSKESSQLTELETEINRDWALSTNVTAGFSFWGVSVSSHFSNTWGEKFKKVDNTTTKVTVAIAVDAIEDDRIYAIVMDYDVWEYPVYVNGEVKAHALVVEPHAIENRWFPSKSWSGYSYIPDHEVSNILSYREYPLLSDNPLLDEKIKGDYNNSFVLDANSSYDWTLQFDDFQSSQASTTKEYTRDWGASVSGWGVGFSINGNYHSEDINTQRTEVATGLKLSSHLDGIDMGIGEVGYIVTPYAYWAKNGALVLDYAVKPELADIGGTPTWWQVHYGDLADPAFILPWHYDPEKGFTLEEEAKRYQTKDLQFFPANPRAGDDVTIKARVHNFSLIPTPGLIGVKFYLGDPDSGGVLLEDVNGQTEVFTDQAIPARGSETVHFTWTVGNDVGAFSRIYSVIDADDQLAEIHENNNKSWAILNKSTSTGVEQKNADVPLDFELFQNYPNPFNPSTIIKYSITRSSIVVIKIFDILGSEIETLVDEEKPAGIYEVEFNVKGLSSGVYFYKIHAGDYINTKKMILLR